MIDISVNACQDLIRDYFKQLGLEVYAQTNLDGSLNIMLRVPGYQLLSHKITKDVLEEQILDFVKAIEGSDWYQAKQAELNSEIRELKQRVKELEKYESYVQVQKEIQEKVLQDSKSRGGSGIRGAGSEGVSSGTSLNTPYED